MQAQSALSRGNLDLAEALLDQIVKQETKFGNGLVVEELERVRKQLKPIQIERLRKMADDAHARGTWRQKVGALRALVKLLPDDEDAVDRLPLAEDCHKHSWLYDNVRAFVQSGNEAAARVALAQLWEKAPYFGDPENIAPNGIKPPMIRRQLATLFLKPSHHYEPRLPHPIVIETLPYKIGMSSELYRIIHDPTLVSFGAQHSYGFKNARIITDKQGRFGVEDTYRLFDMLSASVLADPLVKRMLRKRSTEWQGYISDIYVNNKKMRHGSIHWLHDRDEIRIGSTTLVFRLPLSYRSGNTGINGLKT